jgi:hypothetical protein
VASRARPRAQPERAPGRHTREQGPSNHATRPGRAGPSRTAPGRARRGARARHPIPGTGPAPTPQRGTPRPEHACRAPPGSRTPRLCASAGPTRTAGTDEPVAAVTPRSADRRPGAIEIDRRNGQASPAARGRARPRRAGPRAPAHGAAWAAEETRTERLVQTERRRRSVASAQPDTACPRRLRVRGPNLHDERGPARPPHLPLPRPAVSPHPQPLPAVLRVRRGLVRCRRSPLSLSMRHNRVHGFSHRTVRTAQTVCLGGERAEVASLQGSASGRTRLPSRPSFECRRPFKRGARWPIPRASGLRRRERRGRGRSGDAC